MRRARVQCEVRGAEIRPTLRWLERVGRVCWYCHRELKDEGGQMPDLEVVLALERYLWQTGNIHGALGLYLAHAAWRRARGLKPADWRLAPPCGLGQ